MASEASLTTVPMKRIARSLTLCILLSCSLWAQSGPFLFVFLNTNPGKPDLSKEQVDSIMAGHLANITRLANEGKIIAAGPFQGGGGIFVFATDSKDSAWSWLGTDPGIRAKRWIIETMPYVPRIGSICSVGEDYEMTSYTFVRYMLAQTSTKKSVLDGSDSHLEYINATLPKDSVVAEGILSDGMGSILVLRGEWAESAFLKEPLVQKKVLDVLVRKIWIARGSFCER